MRADAATPVLWAQQSGIFKRHGIDVKLEGERSGAAVAAGIAGGAYGIGNSSLVGLINAHAHGLPFVLIAAGGLYQARNPTVGLLVGKDSTVRTGADLNAKTLAVYALNDLNTVAGRLWIDRNGGDSSTVKQVEIPISAIADALAAGRADAGTIGSPDFEQAIASGKVRLLAYDYDAIAREFLYTSWFATEEFVAKNPRVARAFADAMRESATYTNAHPAATTAAMAAFSGMEPALVAKMRRVANGTALEPRLLQPLIDASARYKIVPAAIDARELIAKGF